MNPSPSHLALTELWSRLERDAGEATTAERRAALLWDAARAAQLAGSKDAAAKLYEKVLATQSPSHLADMAWVELLAPGIVRWEIAHGLLDATTSPTASNRAAWELLCATRAGAERMHPDALAALAHTMQLSDGLAAHLLWCAAIAIASPTEHAQLLADRRAKANISAGSTEAYFDWLWAQSTWDITRVESRGVAQEDIPALNSTPLQTAWILAALRGARPNDDVSALQHARWALLHEDLADAQELNGQEQFAQRCLAAVHYAYASDVQASARNLVAAESLGQASQNLGQSLTFLQTLLGVQADIIRNDGAPSRQLRALRNYQASDAVALQFSLRDLIEKGEWNEPLTQLEMALWPGQLFGSDLVDSVQRAMANTEDTATRVAYVALATCLVAAGQGRTEDAQALLALAPANRSAIADELYLQAAHAAAVAFSDPSFLSLAARHRTPLLDALSGTERRAQGFAELEHDEQWAWPVIAAAWALAPRSDMPRQEALADRCLRAASSAEERAWAFQLGLGRLPSARLWAWFERAPSALVPNELKAKASFVRALTSGRQELAAERAIAWSEAEPENHHDTRAVALLAAAHCDAATRPERATQHALAAAALSSAERGHTHAALERALASGGSLRGVTVPAEDAAMAGRVAVFKLFQGLRAEAKDDLVRLAEHTGSEQGVVLAANLLRAVLHGASMLAPTEGGEGHDSETTARALRRSGAPELVAVLRRTRAKSPADTVAAAAGLFAQRPSSATWLDWARAALLHHDDEALLGALHATAMLEGVSAQEVAVVAALADGYLGDPSAIVPVPEGHGESYALMHLDTHPPGSAPDDRANALLAAAQTAPSEEQLDVLAIAGWNQYAAGDSLASREAFRAVTTARPLDVAAWEGLRRSAISIDDLQGERDSTRSLAALVRSPARRGLLCFRAFECAFAAGDVNEAELYLAEAVNLCPDQDAWAEMWLTRASSSESRTERATLVASLPGRPRAKSDAHWILARSYREAGELEREASELQNLLHLAPNHAGGLALQAELFLKLGHLNEAIVPLRRILSLDSLPANHRVMAAVGLAETLGHKLALPQQALSVLDDALQEFPSDLRLVESAARYASELGLSERAEQGFKQVAEQGGEPGRRARAAKLSIELGRTRGASEPPVEMLAVLAELEPENEQHVADLTLAVARLRRQSGEEGAAPLARAEASFETHRQRLLHHPVDERAVHQHALLAQALGKDAEHDAAIKVLRALSPHRVSHGARFEPHMAQAAVSMFELQFTRMLPSRLAKPKELGVNPRDKLRADGGPWASLLEQVGPLFDVNSAGAFMLSSRTRLPAIGWDKGVIWALPLADSANDAEAWVSYVIFLLATYRGLPARDAMKLAVLATDEATLGVQLARASATDGNAALLSPADVYRYVLSEEFLIAREQVQTAYMNASPQEAL